jgi:holo-[acyl-carrier protein] synthase
MIFGIGTDILSIERIGRIFANPDDPFFLNTFSDKEKVEASEYPDPVTYFSTRFAGKEAVIKSIGLHEDMKLKEIEILKAGSGQPCVALTGSIKKIACENGIKRVLISLSCDDYAIAFAVAEC